MNQFVLSRPFAAGRRTVSVAAVAVLLLMAALSATPAEARSTYLSKVSGTTADTYWTQIDGTEPGTSPLGNVHTGWLYAYETTKGKADVFGGIEDWDCEPGELPGGGGHGEFDEPEPGNCTFKGYRAVESYGIAFSVDKKLNEARLTGTLTIYGGGHGEGGVVGRPYADIVWTGVGGTYTDMHRYRYKDGDVMMSGTYKSTSRTALMSGIMGPMGFDPDFSGGYMSIFSSSSKERIK